jgi:enolase
MFIIQSIGSRRILNSHVEFTNEFIIRFEDGSTGTSAAPRGETTSIYEGRHVDVDPAAIIRQMEQDGCLGRPLGQESFDEYLQGRIPVIGRNNACSLSLAFFNAAGASRSASELFGRPEGPRRSAPRICCNILNGGRHAYTNPVLSDFPEFLLVAASRDIQEVIADHNEIQRAVKEQLLTKEKTVVSGNPVHQFATADNRECIDFLLSIRDKLSLSGKFELMIDASGGDLRTGEGYAFDVTDRSVRSDEGFFEYWSDMIRQYGIAFLEDPFHENDTGLWRALTAAPSSCKIIGDNFYSSDAERIARGTADRCTHGVVIKPNQSGTVSAVRKAVETARSSGQIMIASHRSVSTEETFLSLLTCMEEVPLIKVGPLTTDYSAVIRLNEIIRLTE